ncbi:hypothetical protein FQN57_004440 [Myotisia sp. PD_48]|nr:hypothetical protein FQN57_004440 [Myotisia sp. PD_48]
MVVRHIQVHAGAFRCNSVPSLEPYGSECDVSKGYTRLSNSSSGGYHPGHLLDVFNRRYEVIGKLSYGQFSTVWLANDQLLQRHVALKILQADISKDNRELSNLLRLSVPALDHHPGKQHVIELLDYFKHVGPNGTHLCLVLPIMMCDGEEMTATRIAHHPAYIKAISKQVLLGLDFLHALGLVHCDLQPANILFSVVGYTYDQTFLQPPEFSPVRWLSGVESDNSAPEYLMASQRCRGKLDNVDLSTLVVKIADLGEGNVHLPLYQIQI